MRCVVSVTGVASSSHLSAGCDGCTRCAYVGQWVASHLFFDPIPSIHTHSYHLLFAHSVFHVFPSIFPQGNIIMLLSQSLGKSLPTQGYAAHGQNICFIPESLFLIGDLDDTILSWARRSLPRDRVGSSSWSSWKVTYIMLYIYICVVYAICYVLVNTLYVLKLSYQQLTYMNE